MHKARTQVMYGQSVLFVACPTIDKYVLHSGNYKDNFNQAILEGQASIYLSVNTHSELLA